MKKFAPFLKLYSEYVKNFDHSLNVINSWMIKSPAFAGIVEKIQVSHKVYFRSVLVAIYRKTSNISCTKSPNLNDSCLIL